VRKLLQVLLLVLALSSAAFSCSCFHFGECPGLGGKTGPVFLGTVLAVTDLPLTTDFQFLSSRRVRFRVDEPFGGLAPGVPELDVLTGRGGGDCGIPFRVGDVYLIDASSGKDGVLHVGICSSTRRIGAAGAALRVLRQRRDGGPLPALVGRIAQRDRDFDGILGTHKPKPLPNVLVRVKAGGMVYETRADTEGLYAFYDLPSGQYEFTPDLPPGTALSWYIGSDRPMSPVQLTAGACQERNIDVFASASIQGRVLDSSNRPVANALVYILPADEKEIPKDGRLYWASQGKEGFFKLVHLPPGRYVIFVNPNDSRNPQFPYARTFYPGVHDRASAAVIGLSVGDQIKNADIRLQQPFPIRRVTARVTWADGRLVRDFVFVHAKGTGNRDATAGTSHPDKLVSVVDLTVFSDEPYEVEAELTCRYADDRSVGPGKTLKSNRVYLAPGDSRTELLLTMPGTACPERQGNKLLTEP
jgi:hypothetical protein